MFDMCDLQYDYLVSVKIPNPNYVAWAGKLEKEVFAKDLPCAVAPP